MATTFPSRYSPGELLSYFEAVFLLAVAFGIVRGLAFRRWEKILGDRSQRGTIRKSTAPQPGSSQVKRALKRLHARRGQKYTCLMFTVAGRLMLWRRGLDSEVSIGVKLDNNGSATDRFGAHSWLSSNGYPVFGQQTRNRYHTIALYRSK